MSKENDDFMKLARKRAGKAMDAFSENRRYQVDDLKFSAGNSDNNWQWPAALLNARLSSENPGGARPCLTINKLPQHIKLVTNEQRQNRPAIKIIPVDEDSDIAVADILGGIIRHIETSSDSDIAYDTACENQVTHGEGYFRVLTEYVDPMSFDQDILIAPIENSFCVYLDPDGLRKDPTGAKCEWGFITDEMTKEEFKAEFPDATDPKDWDFEALGDEASFWSEGENVRIAEYFYFKKTRKTICLWSDKSVSEKTEGYKPPDGVTLLKERETTVKQCKWAKLCGDDEPLETNDWAGKYIPIVRVVGNQWIIEGKTIVSGIVRNAKDAQRMGNYFESMDAEFVALAPKAPYIVAEGQIAGNEEQWGKANVVPYAFLEYKMVDLNGIIAPPPQRQLPPMASSAILQAKLAAWDNVQSTVGQYNPSLGAEAKEKSGVAINARQRQADVGTFHYVDNLSRAIRHLGRILVDLAPKIFDTKRVARIMGLDGKAGQCQLDPGQECAVTEVKDELGQIEKIYNINVGRYDVTVTVGPGYNSKRQEAAEFMAQVLQGNKELMGVMGDLYFKMLDVPGADKIAERIKRSIPPQLTQDENENKADPEVQQQQIKRAAEMLGQREAELNAQEQQLQEAGQSVSEQEQKAKEAMGKVQGEIAKLNTLVDELQNQRELFELQKKLADKDIELQSSELESEKKIIVAEVKAIQAKMDAKLAQINNAAQAAGEAEQSLADKTSQQELMEAVAKLSQLVSAKRKTVLVTDDQGNPVGSESTLIEEFA